MPFTSRRQQRAAFGGHIPGFSKARAKEWAAKTDFEDLPNRAPAEKGKPTLRSKEAAKGLGYVVGQLMKPKRATIVKTSSLEVLIPYFVKLAQSLVSSQEDSPSSEVGRVSGIMTENALKAPGPAASTQAVNPRRNLKDAMNAFRA